MKVKKVNKDDYRLFSNAVQKLESLGYDIPFIVEYNEVEKMFVIELMDNDGYPDFEELDKVIDHNPIVNEELGEYRFSNNPPRKKA